MEDQPTGIKNRAQIQCSVCADIFAGVVRGPLPGTMYVPGLGMVEALDGARLVCEPCGHFADAIRLYQDAQGPGPRQKTTQMWHGGGAVRGGMTKNRLEWDYVKL